jgi:2-dehydro-3-deoxyglucarate aldolase
MQRIDKIRNIRDKLNDGRYSLGTWIQIPHPSVAEVIGQSGYDWAAIDMEHGAISVAELPDLFRALELSNTLPLVRVAEGHSKDCKQALDAGAGGIIVPMVESAQQLEKVIDSCCWPPKGTRGVGFSRANLFGKNFSQYTSEAQQPIIVAMIENIKAVDNLQSILKVDGVDAIFIGPYDLSASMGKTADFENPDFLLTVKKIIQTAEAENKPFGIHIVEPKISQLKLRLKEGYRFIAYSVDSVFLRESSEIPKDFK